MANTNTFFYHEPYEPLRTLNSLTHFYSKEVIENYLRIFRNKIKILKNKFVAFVWLVVEFLIGVRGAA